MSLHEIATPVSAPASAGAEPPCFSTRLSVSRSRFFSQWSMVEYYINRPNARHIYFHSQIPKVKVFQQCQVKRRQVSLRA